jgi:hypothetical protein
MLDFFCSKGKENAPSGLLISSKQTSVRISSWRGLLPSSGVRELSGRTDAGLLVMMVTRCDAGIVTELRCSFVKPWLFGCSLRGHQLMLWSPSSRSPANFEIDFTTEPRPLGQENKIWRILFCWSRVRPDKSSPATGGMGG